MARWCGSRTRNGCLHGAELVLKVESIHSLIGQAVVLPRKVGFCRGGRCASKLSASFVDHRPERPRALCDACDDGAFART